MVLEQGNWLLIDLTVSVTDAFWKAWRKDKASLKAKGYRVATSIICGVKVIFF